MVGLRASRYVITIALLNRPAICNRKLIWKKIPFSLPVQIRPQLFHNDLALYKLGILLYFDTSQHALRCRLIFQYIYTYLQWRCHGKEGTEFTLNLLRVSNVIWRDSKHLEKIYTLMPYHELCGIKDQGMEWWIRIQGSAIRGIIRDQYGHVERTPQTWDLVNGKL